jgi:glyoxylase-like metal-dependent hydrolase (beta-lactamase superfamily II)/rhodanese-related sulfurtransferase
VDTRPAESFESWHVHGAENVPFDPTEGFDDEHREAVEAVADGEPVVVVCGKGLTSTPFGILLEDDGYERRDNGHADERASGHADERASGHADDVTVVRGGMQEWSTIHEVADVGNEDIVIRQLQRRATGCLGYVVVDPGTGEAVVVDPTRQTDEFAVAAEAAGLTVTGVVDTHVHADHLSGGPDLAAELAVPYYLGVDVEDPVVDHEYDSLEDGRTLAVGDVEVRAVHGPGHTDSMVNLVVEEGFLLSADTLHVESVGRTELAFGEDRAEEGAKLLFETLHDRLLELPDDVTVLPGHVSITEDNRYEVGRPGDPIEKRLGDIRRDLALLGYDRQAFVEELTADFPEKPDEYETVVAINAGEASVETEEDAAELETGPNNCSA